MSSARVQIFVYPEELEHTPPAELVGQVLALGADTVSMAVSYHRARRVLPRHRRVSVLARRAFYLTPDSTRYGAITPPHALAREWPDRLRRFRAACADGGLGFRAWVVALHDEELAAAHPAAAARLIDGSPAGHSLCPSAPETIEYAAALAGDVAAQLEPDAVDVEAALYPAWEPSYTLTLSLAPLAASALHLVSQCVCPACARLLGDDLLARVRNAAGRPFSSNAHADLDLDGALAAARSSGATRLTTAVAEAVRAAGSRACLFVSGPPEDAAVRGASVDSFAPADEVLFGCGPLRRRELDTRFAGLRVLAGRTGAVAMNWVPERAGEFASDAARVASAGATGLALYNLSLVPDAALADLRAAAAAFRSA